MKLKDYIIVFIMMTVVSTVFHFIGKQTEVINNNYYKDSIIERYHETLKYFEQKIIKNHYEQKTDSIIISYMYDSLLSRAVMFTTKRILDFGFTETDTDSIKQSGTLPTGNNSSEKPFTDSKRDD